MTICPCCGAKNSSAWSNGCAACGATPVGEPLPRPDHELPSYGRSLLLTITGALTVLVFLLQTAGAFAKNIPTEKTYRETFAAAGVVVIDFWRWVAAAETAAWKLKWVAIPFTLLLFFAIRKIYTSVRNSPEQFCGLRYARGGFVASAAVPALIALLIGVTVPARLEQRRDGLEAGIKARAYRIDRALDQYREQFNTLPSDLKDLRRLPDDDGSLASALNDIDVSPYKPGAELAAVPVKSPRRLRGGVISNASSESSDTLNEGFSFTNYELPMPGYDNKFGTEDDLLLLDGVVYKASDAPRRAGTSPSAAIRQP